LGLYYWGGIAASCVHLAWCQYRGQKLAVPSDKKLGYFVEVIVRARSRHSLTPPQEVARKENISLDQARAEVVAWVRKNCDVPALGASGSVMAIAALCAVLHPRDTVRFRLISMPVALAVGLYAASDALSITRIDGVAHAMHLGGAALGLSYAAIRKRYLVARSR
jgi:hypothetical protein